MSRQVFVCADCGTENDIHHHNCATHERPEPLDRPAMLKLMAQELKAWPQDCDECARTEPTGWGWRWHDVPPGEFVLAVPGRGCEWVITERDWMEARWTDGEERMDAIGPNGPSGEHYDAIYDRAMERVNACQLAQEAGPRTCPGCCRTVKADEVLCSDCLPAATAAWANAQQASEEPPAETLARFGAGRKDDAAKPRLDLLLADMPHALEAIAMVLTHGAEKYAPGNWQHVPDAQRRYLAAGLRHEVELAKGVHHDAETGEHHLAHAACCLLFRLELLLREDF